MHRYPTFGDGPSTAAVADVRAWLGEPVARSAVRVLLGLRRMLVDRRAAPP